MDWGGTDVAVGGVEGAVSELGSAFGEEVGEEVVIERGCQTNDCLGDDRGKNSEREVRR